MKLFLYTEFAVEIFSKAVPEGLGQIDMDYASRVSRLVGVLFVLFLNTLIIIIITI